MSGKFEYGVIKSGEEGAELAQVAIKILLHMDEFEMKDGNEFYEKLVEEFGDVVAITDFCYNYAPEAFRKRVDERVKYKLDKHTKRFDDTEAG